MRREKSSGLSLSRSAQASVAVLITVILAGAARAYTIQKVFIDDGTARNVWGMNLGSCRAGANCSFSGTLTTDVSIGRVTISDITFPGRWAFDELGEQSVLSPGFSSRAFVSFDGVSTPHDNVMFLIFVTPHAPASLVGLDGGRITFGHIDAEPVTGLTFYTSISRSLTRVPEPSSLGLLGTGLLGLAGLVRRKLKRLPTASTGDLRVIETVRQSTHQTGSTPESLTEVLSEMGNYVNYLSR